MGIINSVKKALSSVFKSPSFLIASTSSYNDKINSVGSGNYLEQFESWTYKAIKVKADALIGYKQKFSINEKEIEITKNPLLFDLNFPNDFMSYNDLRKMMVYHMSLCGRAVWLMTESERKGHNADFYPLDPTKLKFRAGPDGLPKDYVYTDANGREQIILPENLIIFNNPDPKDFLKGYGDLQGSRFAHNTYELMMKFNMNWFGNSGRPEGFMVYEGAGDTTVEKLEAQLKQKYSGTRNARRIGVLNKKFEYVELMKTQKDLDFSNGTVNMRDEILAIQGVPKTLAGLDDASYANAEQALRIFQSYTLTPLLQMEEDVYNSQLLIKYGRVLTEGSFKHENCIMIDSLKEAQAQTLLYEKGVAKLNEVRIKVGLPEDLENGDNYYSPPQQFMGLPMGNGDQTPVENTEEDKPVADDNNKKINNISLINKNLSLSKLSISNVLSNKNLIEQEELKLKAFYLEKNIAGEKDLVSKFNGFFDEQLDRVVKQVFKSKTKAINLDYKIDWTKEIELMFSFMLDPYVKESMKWNLIANEMTGAKIQWDKEIQSKIKRNLKVMTSNTTQTTKDDIARVINNSIKNDWDQSTTKNEIKKLFDIYKNGSSTSVDSRSESISRTEVNSVKNETARWNYAQNKYVEGYDWLDAGDSEVRDEHRNVRSVTKGQKFNVGGEYLEYPGDKRGSAGNIINCRCTVIPNLIQG
jgi:HK97 family phage portal protein